MSYFSLFISVYLAFKKNQSQSFDANDIANKESIVPEILADINLKKKKSNTTEKYFLIFFVTFNCNPSQHAWCMTR